MTLRTEVACYCPPRGALIPRAFRLCAVYDFSYRLLARLVNLWVAERDATPLACRQFVAWQ
jgi:hypothetical protein